MRLRRIDAQIAQGHSRPQSPSFLSRGRLQIKPSGSGDENGSRSALVNIRRKALLSSVGFRKPMTTRGSLVSGCFPSTISIPVAHVCFCFDRIL